jgi:acetylglutamate kinase
MAIASLIVKRVDWFRKGRADSQVSDYLATKGASSPAAARFCGRIRGPRVPIIGVAAHARPLTPRCPEARPVLQCAIRQNSRPEPSPGEPLSGRRRPYCPSTKLEQPVVRDAIEKADLLIEAMGWIRQFRDKITVIKLGGSVMEDPESLRHLLVDIVFMETVGMRPIVVHGGGAAITRAMDEAQIEARFIQGRRYTDDATLKIVERVLAGEINESIAARIEEFGGRAMPLNFAREQNNNVLFGERLTLSGKNGEEIDLGHVGRVTHVDRDAIENLCYAGQVPVIPSMCETDSGERLNVNADTAATAVAQALGAEKLVFLSDVNGVRRDKNDPDSLLHSLTAKEARRLIAEGAIDAGMIPKVEACLETLQKGVRKIHIIDGRIRHSLMLEIYTNQGIGTEIIAS